MAMQELQNHRKDTLDPSTEPLILMDVVCVHDPDRKYEMFEQPASLDIYGTDI